MAKRYEPGQETFQPIEQALLRQALDDREPTNEAPQESAALAKTSRKIVPLEPPGHSPPGQERVTRQVERLNAPLKVHLQPAERRELNRLLNQLSHELRTTVSASHIQRALLTVLQHAESEILKRAHDHGPMKRPPNDNLAAIATFDFRLAKLLLGGIRLAPPLRESPRE